MIVWPTVHTTFVDWANNLRQLRPDIDINPIVHYEKQWSEWANQVVQSSVCQNFQCPRSDNFKSWQEWSIAFIKAFSVNA